MRLEQLNYLIAIDRYHSMNKAAGNIFVSQQTISNAIMQLEEEFQIELVLRTNRGSFLTEAGQELSQAAQDFYTRCHAVKARFGQQKLPEKMHLLIEYSQLSTWDALFLFYTANYPQVELERTTIDYVDLGETLEKYPKSIAVCYLHEAYYQRLSQNYYCDVIKTQSLSLCVSRSSPLAQSKSLSLKSLRNMKILLYTLKEKPSALTLLLEEYGLEARGNKFIYQVTATLQKTLGQQNDVICFAPDAISAVALDTMVTIALKEKLMLHLCCISKGRKIPAELKHAVDTLL